MRAYAPRMDDDLRRRLEFALEETRRAKDANDSLIRIHSLPKGGNPEMQYLAGIQEMVLEHIIDFAEHLLRGPSEDEPPPTQ